MKINHVTKTYHHKEVLQDINLEIKKHQISSFIGANGAGKSTLLALMSRLIKPDKGEVTLDGKNILDWKSKELAKRVSILKQNNEMNMRLTVRELVAFGRFPYSEGRLSDEDEAKIDEALAYMGMHEMQAAYINELSGGQRQRAFIAMVVAQDTDYIFLDEPLNNLDMKHSVQMMQMLRRLTRELGKTIVLVLHDINFASCYSDHIVALSAGQLVAEGSPKEMITQDALRQIFEMEIPIAEIDGARIGIYFDPARGVMQVVNE